MNNQIQNSQVALKFNISSNNKESSLWSYVGKTAVYKEELKNDDKFIRAHGTIVKNTTWLVKETQINYLGEECVRMYCIENGDKFGRCVSIDHISIV